MKYEIIQITSVLDEHRSQLPNKSLPSANMVSVSADVILSATPIVYQPQIP